MRQILKYVTNQLKNILSIRQEQTQKSLSTIAYTPGTQCFLNGRIDRALVGYGRPLVVEVSPLNLIEDLRQASSYSNVEFISPTGPGYPDVPNSVRALAFAAGGDVPLGCLAEAEDRLRRRARISPRRRHAA
jgi:hypothetical protein